MKIIMVVDDDKEFLDEITVLLNSKGYVTVPMCDESGVVVCASKIKPNVILLDLKLGNISGFNLARDLKRMPETKDIPLVAITGYYTEDEYQELVNVCGIKKRLVKPIAPDDVTKVIDEVMITSV